VTPTTSAFYLVLPPSKGFGLADRVVREAAFQQNVDRLPAE